MAIVDPNDNILKWENGDLVTPLSTKMNTHLDSVGLVTNKLNREGIYRVNTVPERTALVNLIGSTNINNSNPLIVWRANASAGQQLEYTTNGGNWYYVKTSQSNWEDIDFPITNPQFRAYNEGQRPRIYRQGKVVTLAGAFGVTEEDIIVPNNGPSPGVVPERFRPPFPINTLCQGSSKNYWNLTINADGFVTCSRYSATSHAASVWLPHTVTWVIP